ncbi:MAG TPA: SDR family oxidoreductase [Lichenihabitans sp.]|nr:SDR family oxidoreductase [Lichenihabitans sp.]
MNLFVFGIGYTAGHCLRDQRSRFARVAGTVRTRERCDELARDGITAFVFDGDVVDARIVPALDEADAILVSVQPHSGRDPVLERFADRIRESPARSLVYLSTIGVYGDHGGAWIDETTPPAPESERGRQRLAVEDEWLALGALSAKSVAVLRLAGIYGPGRNVLDDLRAGEARRIDKPGQVFNRIHVADIGQAIAGALAERAHGTWNIADDEPAPAPDVVAYGATLLGVAPPPLIPFADAELSPMARSFYGANRRVSNDAMKRDLGVRLNYPTYRDGLKGILATMGLA